jgi:hypothetical protein
VRPRHPNPELLQPEKMTKTTSFAGTNALNSPSALICEPMS